MSLSVNPSYSEILAGIENVDERETAELFIDMGLFFIGSNVKIHDSQDNEIGEIDLIFEFNNYLFLVEVTSQKKNLKAKMGHWYSRWSNEENMDLLRDKTNKRLYKMYKIFIVLSSDYGTKKFASLDHLLSNKYNKLLFRDDIEYYKESITQIGEVTRNDFFNLIGFPRRTISRKVPALKFYIDNVPAYCFIGRVDELLETCYVKRRYKKDVGYQRALDYSRLREISGNIIKRKIVAFPNAIIVNSVEKLSNDSFTEIDCPVSVEIDLPISYCELKVVDGQHRLLGFSKVDDEIKKSSHLPVIAFENMSLIKELKMFVDINSKQKRVNPNLVLLLKNDCDWNPEDREYYEKIAVMVCIKLDEKGPLARKIYFGRADEKSKGKVRLSTLVSAFINNGLIRKRKPLWQKEFDDSDTPFKKADSFIRSINKNLYEFKLDDRNFFLTTRGLRIIFRLIRIMEMNRAVKLVHRSNEQIISDIKEILNHKIFEEFNQSYGEGGAKNSAVFLCNYLINGLPKYYKNLELNLRSLSQRRR